MKYQSFFLATLFSLLVFSCSKKNDTPAPVKSSAKDLATFSFLKTNNPSLPQDYTATISGTSVSLQMPNGINLTNLVATFILSDKAAASVGTTTQVSGQTSNNFSAPVSYSIKAEDGSSRQYTVTITQSGIMANTNVNASTSYSYLANTKSFINYSGLFTNYHPFSYLGRVAYDFDGDGDEDLLAANASGTQNTEPFVYFRNNGTTFSSYASIFGNTVPALVHPRKAIVGDFNKDGKMDAVVTGHGWDQSPFPGEKPYLLLNNGTTFQSSVLPLSNGFYHSVTAGDVDNDGDADLFFTDNMHGHKLLLNNGQGNFAANTTILPQDIAAQYFTSEFFDINNDGYLDLLVAGHEFEGSATAIYWGSSSGTYTSVNKTILPAVSGKGIVIDIDFFDIDADGKTDIMLNRTGNNPFYSGFYIQLVKNNGSTFSDVTATAITNNGTATGDWVSWLRFYDYDNDGKKDIIADDQNLNLKWKNINGVFTRQ
jgi:hypothetical protein